MARPASYSTLFSVSSNSFKNEAQVETRFAAPLFTELGYRNVDILPKERVPKLFVSEGSQRKELEVDFLLLDPDGHASVVVEVKSPSASALGKTDPGVLAMNDPWTEHDREHVITGGTKGAVSCCGV